MAIGASNKSAGGIIEQRLEIHEEGEELAAGEIRRNAVISSSNILSSSENSIELVGNRATDSSEDSSELVGDRRTNSSEDNIELVEDRPTISTEDHIQLVGERATTREDSTS